MILVYTTTIGSKIGTMKSAYKSSFINFVLGLSTSFILFLLFYEKISISIPFTQSYIYFGGFIAAFVVIISNYIIAKIGVFFATLLGVVGQLLMGTIIDWIRFDEYPIWPTIGGIFILVGLIYIHIIEKKQLVINS